MKPQRSILLVEDNPMDVELTLRAFERRGTCNRIEVARDGQEALDWIPRWEDGEPLPVVVLLDLKLPKAGGLDVLKRLKSHPKFRRLPVVVLTTSTEIQEIRRAYELGANSYIVKPVNFEKFLEVAGVVEMYWALLNETPD